MSLEEEILEELKKNFPEAIIDAKVQKKQRIVVTIKKEYLLDLCKFLKEKLGFDHLSCVSGVDFPDRFEVVHHLCSYSKKCILALKTPLQKGSPKISSVTQLWGSANWLERETYDLFGIIFEGHPNLTRILLPEDWEGHPLRKDFKMIERPWF